MKTKIKPELLAPAGNLEKLKYAFAYGADAVYAGVPRFSLRTRENDFREESLIAGIQYARNLGRKVYLTLNIFAHNAKVDGFIRELEKVVEWEPALTHGIRTYFFFDLGKVFIPVLLQCCLICLKCFISGG